MTSNQRAVILINQLLCDRQDDGPVRHETSRAVVPLGALLGQPTITELAHVDLVRAVLAF